MEKHHFITIADLSRDDLMYLLSMADQFERHPNRELLKGKVVATLFFEPSTRTRLSFETAANRLGARVIGFSDAKASSVVKGETLKDTILMVSNYADVIAMRHYIEGAAQYASEIAPIPIINAGDGAHMHPSQCLLDIYSIYKTQGTLDNLNIYLVGDLRYGRTVHSLIMAMRHFNPTFHFIAPNELAMHPSQCLLDIYSIYKTQGTLDNLNIYLVGDLRYGRTVHSLIMAMRHFNPTFHFIAPNELAMPDEYKLYCKEHNIKYEEHTEFNEEMIVEADILYMTRVQKERFSDLMEYERVKNSYVLRNSMLNNVKENMKILHPLPRVNEIAYDVDDNPHAYYIQQAQNGLYAREAIFCHCLGISLEDIKNDKTIID